MGRHSRAPRRFGHGPATRVARPLCGYDAQHWPEWLMYETAELIDEVMEWQPGDDDDDGHSVPAKT